MIEVRLRDQAVILVHRCDNRIRSRPGIKTFRSILGDESERPGKLRLAKNRAGTIKFSIVQENAARVVELIQEFAVGTQAFEKRLADEETVSRKTNRRRDDPRETK